MKTTSVTIPQIVSETENPSERAEKSRSESPRPRISSNSVNDLSTTALSAHLIDLDSLQKILDPIKKVFQEKDRQNVKKCVEDFLNPSHPLIPIHVEAIQVGIRWGHPCKLEEDAITPFLSNLVAAGVLVNDGNDKLSAQIISKETFDVLQQALEKEF